MTFFALRPSPRPTTDVCFHDYTSLNPHPEPRVKSNDDRPRDGDSTERKVWVKMSCSGRTGGRENNLERDLDTRERDPNRLQRNGGHRESVARRNVGGGGGGVGRS